MFTSNRLTRFVNMPFNHPCSWRTGEHAELEQEGLRYPQDALSEQGSWLHLRRETKIRLEGTTAASYNDSGGRIYIIYCLYVRDLAACM